MVGMAPLHMAKRPSSRKILKSQKNINSGDLKSEHLKSGFIEGGFQRRWIQMDRCYQTAESFGTFSIQSLRFRCAKERFIFEQSVTSIQVRVP